MSQELQELETLVPPTADYGTKNYRAYNRGNKLKRVAQEPAHATCKPSILPLTNVDDVWNTSHMGKKRAIMRKIFAFKELKDDLTSARHLIEDDPYLEVSIDDAWALPDTMEQVRSIESMVHTLRSRHLRGLAEVAMEMIETDASLYRLLSRLGDWVQDQDVSVKSQVAAEENSSDALSTAQEDIQEAINCTQEYLNQMIQMRGRVMAAYLKKKKLAKIVAPFEK